MEEQKKSNIHIKDGTDKSQFIEWRANRDGGLNHPRLIIPAIQVNLQAGKFPKAESNGQTYLKIPINVMKAGSELTHVE